MSGRRTGARPGVKLSLLRADLAGQVALHPSHGIGMEEMPCGCPVEKDLYLPVLDFGRLGVLGVFDALHGRPKSGPHGAVTRVRISAQADALFCTLEIRQFGSFDPLDSGPRLRSAFSGKYRRNERPHQEPRGRGDLTDLLQMGGLV